MSESGINLGTAPQVASQYHHFIPRFILRNFKHPFRPVASKGRRRFKNDPRYGDDMLYAIDLAGNGDVIEAPVSKSFGLTDMYRDFRDAGNQHHIEESLSKLESEAGQIIARIRKKHEAGSPEVWMTRKERDTLRKFLFIMKYRSSRFHRRFNHSTTEEYCEDDKEYMLKYMREKGFDRPIDVWFANIKAILDLNMDADGDWPSELIKKIYPTDAMWAVAHIQTMYLALCTPANHSDEFLLSENLFSIHEGPNSFSVDVNSGEEIPSAYTEYHTFAAIAPRLMVVLRSNLLPNAEEDTNEEVKNNRQLMYNTTKAMHNDPLNAVSILEDLPIRKANNSYTEIVQGQRRLLPGEDGSPRADHNFGFPFFSIGPKHVNMINLVTLQQAYSITTLCFHSKPAVRKTLDWYLITTMKGPNGYALKAINGPADPRLLCIKKLEYAARCLGSNATASYTSMDFGPEPQDIVDQLNKGLMSASRENPQGLPGSYAKLGGTGATMLYDMEQARKMAYLRIKIDVWSQGLNEDVRNQIRENLVELFCRLLPRRFYLYMKRIRFMLLSKPFEDISLQMGDHNKALIEGPEDVIAQAIQVIRKERITWLMYYATLNDVTTTKDLAYKMDEKMTLGARRVLLLQQRKTAFERAGSICNCGIKVIEARAREAKTVVEWSQVYEEVPDHMFSNEHEIELATRLFVHADFMDHMDGSMPRNELESLKKVLFGTVFPIELW